VSYFENLNTEICPGHHKTPHMLTKIGLLEHYPIKPSSIISGISRSDIFFSFHCGAAVSFTRLARRLLLLPYDDGSNTASSSGTTFFRRFRLSEGEIGAASLILDDPLASSSPSSDGIWRIIKSSSSSKLFLPFGFFSSGFCSVFELSGELEADNSSASVLCDRFDGA
jgi:hypothetical protein